MHSNSGARRRHSAELKAKVLAACDEPGASISGVALAHGLNTNLVRKWRTRRAIKLASLGNLSAVSVGSPRPVAAVPPTVGANPQFVAIEMPTAPKLPAGIAAARAGTTTTPTDAEATDPVIHIELRRGPLHMNVRWPTSAARDCATWLRDLGGLPK